MKMLQKAESSIFQNQIYIEQFEWNFWALPTLNHAHLFDQWSMNVCANTHIHAQICYRKMCMLLPFTCFVFSLLAATHHFDRSLSTHIDIQKMIHMTHGTNYKHIYSKPVYTGTEYSYKRRNENPYTNTHI